MTALQEGTYQGEEGREDMSISSVVLGFLVALLGVLLAGGLVYTGWRECQRRQVQSKF